MDHFPNLDLEFIAVDADARLDDVIGAAGGLRRHIVIRDAPAFGDRPDDEDELWFVVDLGDITGVDHDPEATIGRVLVELAAEPASVLDTAWGMEALAVGRPSGPVVVLDRGLVSGVVPEPPAPRGLPRFGGGLATSTGPFPGGAEPPTAGAEPPTAGAEPGAAGADPAAGSAMAVSATFPPAVAMGDTASLLIALTGDTAADSAIPIVAALGDQIDVVVSPKAGFVVEGRAEGRLQVTGEEEGLPIQIRLRATTEGRGRIVVYAFRDGAALGSLTLAPDVVAEGAGAAAASSVTAELRDAAPADADLELLILEEADANGRTELRYRLSSRDPELRLNLRPFGPVPLEGGPGAYFTDLYRQIEKLPVETEQDRLVATQRMHAIGSDLFATLLPPDLQKLLWDLQGRIRTVWVQSEEPWVPWELCRLQGEQDGRIVEGEFFCEAFELTRWIPGQARLSELTLANIGLIVPADSRLTSAEDEAKMVRALGSAGRVVVDIPADYIEVRKALAQGTHDAIHFTGHGDFPDQSNPTRAEIELAGGQKLRPNDISGTVANLGLAKPLVFFNACQVGRQSHALTGVGGWATALLRAGASAFVGTHWEVTDDLACRFARTFYARLDAGDPIARAARAARLEIRDAGDPTWLAYTVFADPGARAAV
jgi:hypothetical protein